MNKILFPLFFLTTLGLWAHEGHEPAETDYQSDRCAQCNMVVSSPFYAAQIVGPDKPLFFDDIGCLVQYERQGKIKPDAVLARYVRSALGTSWIAADRAVWVLTKEIRTPMGYGLHAFADRPGAEAFAAGKKEVRFLTWAEAQAAVPAKMMMKM